MTEEQLAALLHLKRYEQAPPEYFDRLLNDVHRRQRADVMQSPLWRVAVDRALTFFGVYGRISRAGAFIMVMVIAIVVIGLMPRVGGLSRKDAATPPPGAAGSEPRYVIDRPPFSYDRTSSISF